MAKINLAIMLLLAANMNIERLALFYTRRTIINVINNLLKLHYRQITKPIFD